MNAAARGIRNAFRNAIRTISIIVILGLSIGLALTMLVARHAVGQKIASVKDSIGNTVAIAPAGFSSFSSVNNALTTAQLNKVTSLPHVTNLTETLTDRLTTIGSSQPSFGQFGNKSNTNNTGQTSLTSPTTINFNRNAPGSGGGFHAFFNGGGAGSSLPTNFSLPITIIGTNDPSELNTLSGSTATVTSGAYIGGSKDNNEAMISSAMASKNNLKVGSTFTAYGKTLTVAGIFKTSDQALQGEVVVSLPTEQALSGQSGDVTNAVATVDSLDNLNSVTSSIKNKLGSNADVTSSEQQADATVQPLNSVKNVALFSLIGATIAGAVIILLIMIMIVRERRREIGVLKAVGGSSTRVVLQFMAEAVTFTILGAIIGLIIGVTAGQPVTNMLVSNSSSANSSSQMRPDGFNAGGPNVRQEGVNRSGDGTGFGARLRSNAVGRSFSNIHAAVGWNILLYGLASAIVIALIGSAAASILIARVRPAEVLRTE